MNRSFFEGQIHDWGRFQKAVSDTHTTIIQWLENVDMHVYAKFDQNIPRGFRVISFSLSNKKRTDRRKDGWWTNTMIIY